MELTYYNEMTASINALLQNKRLDGKVLFVFAHCEATERLIDYLKENDVVVTAILDNNPLKQSVVYHGVPVRNPEIIQLYTDKNSAVLIVNKHYEQMGAQLREFGYSGEIHKVVDYNTFTEFSLSDETWERKSAIVKRGAKTLENVRRQYPTQYMIICPYNAFGDVYWAMAFLPAYCRKNSITDTTIVITGNGCRQVAGMFSHKNIVMLERIEMDEFVQAIIFTRETNCMIAHHDRPYTDRTIRLLDKRFISFIDSYRRYVYGLEMDTEPALPSATEPLSDKSKFIKEKTVILSPYAKSVVGVPEDFWKSLAEKYMAQGYRVLTNVAKKEEPIAGTTAISLPLTQMIDAAEYAGVFIGIRSGLCDIIFSAHCQKIVVFFDCIYSTTPWKISDFFDLPGWETIVLPKQ